MSMNPLIESLVVEDEALMRRTVIKRLEASPVGFQVVGEAKNGREALKLIRLLQPKVVFSDVYMPVMDGLELARILQMEFSEIRVVIISGHRDFEYAQKAIRYGVVNYLIKPLEPKALDEVLTSLREGILREQSNLVRRDIEEMLSGGAGRGAGRRFGFFLASLGYSLSAPTVEASMRLKGLWSQVLGQLPEDPDWYVFNGSRTGEMYFLCELSGVNTEIRMERLAKQLFESLLSLSDGHPVNLCAPHGGVTEENLFPVRQQCSRLLLEQQRIGPGAIFWLQESSEETGSHDTLLTMQQMNVIKTLASYRNGTALCRELEKLLTEWDAMGCRQSAFENTLGSVLWMIANSLSGCSEQKVWHAKSTILSHLALSARLVDVIPTVESAVKDMMLSEDAVAGDSSNLGQMIETYIQDHFTEQFSMDTLASHFGFNLSYLTRIFKNYKQESPLKYLISLRMNRALELMRQYPEMDIKSIGEAVGYDDQHYFSRVFKNAMGMSPIKYREALTKGEEITASSAVGLEVLFPAGTSPDHIP